MNIYSKNKCTNSVCIFNELGIDWKKESFTYNNLLRENITPFQKSFKIPLKINVIRLFASNKININQKISMISTTRKFYEWRQVVLGDKWNFFIWTNNINAVRVANFYLVKTNSLYDLSTYTKIAFKIEDYLNLGIDSIAITISKAQLIYEVGGIAIPQEYAFKSSPIILNQIYDFYASIDIQRNKYNTVSTKFISSKKEHPIIKMYLDIIYSNIGIKSDLETNYYNDNLRCQDIESIAISNIPFSISNYFQRNKQYNQDTILPTIILLLYPASNINYKQVVKYKDSTLGIISISPIGYGETDHSLCGSEIINLKSSYNGNYIWQDRMRCDYFECITLLYLNKINRHEMTNTFFNSYAKNKIYYDKNIDINKPIIPFHVHFFWATSKKLMGNPKIDDFIHAKNSVRFLRDLNVDFKFTFWTYKKSYSIDSVLYYQKLNFFIKEYTEIGNIYSSFQKSIDNMIENNLFGLIVDIMKPLVLFIEGGIACDFDFHFMNDLRKLHVIVDSYFGLDFDRCVNNGFIASRSNHPILEQLLEIISDHHFLNNEFTKLGKFHYLKQPNKCFYTEVQGTAILPITVSYFIKNNYNNSDILFDVFMIHNGDTYGDKPGLEVNSIPHDSYHMYIYDTNENKINIFEQKEIGYQEFSGAWTNWCSDHMVDLSSNEIMLDVPNLELYDSIYSHDIVN